MLDSGEYTKSTAVLIGWLTPSHFCRWMNAICCPSPLWLYGGPYPAVPLEPSSSLTPVVTKSTGIARDHCAIVLGLSSGEEKKMVSPTASTATTAIATHSSLIRS